MAISLTEILEKLSKQYGKKIVWEDLDADEKRTFQQWESVLNKAVTVEDIRNFIASQIDQIEREWVNADNSDKKDAVLKARLTNYKMLLAFIAGPERAREYLESEIKRTHNL